MKKTVFSFAALAMTVLLAACGGKSQEAQPTAIVEEVKPAVKVAQVYVRPVDQVRDYVGTVASSWNTSSTFVMWKLPQRARFFALQLLRRRKGCTYCIPVFPVAE